jgi:hypothetical protein
LDLTTTYAYSGPSAAAAAAAGGGKLERARALELMKEAGAYTRSLLSST